MVRRTLCLLALGGSLITLLCSCADSGVPAKVHTVLNTAQQNDVAESGDQMAPITTVDATSEGDVQASSVPAAGIAGNAPQDAPQQPAAPAKRPDIYNTTADATAEVTAAIARAKKDNKRVLVMFGGNWCGWCYKLHDVFEKNREIAQPLFYEYERVMVDIGHFDKNMELAASYGADLKAHGVPFLTVLDADGQVLTNKDTGELEDGPAHDVQKVRDFIQHWAVERVDADQVLSSALDRAKDEGKLVFVHLGAPWCGWCHRLDNFLDEQGSLFERDYVLVKIDIDRMTNGKSLAGKLRDKSADGGIPWFAILNPAGDALTTSDGPKGNIGYPAEPHEIEHFITMLQATAKQMTADDITQVQSLLSEAAKKYLAR